MSFPSPMRRNTLVSRLALLDSAAFPLCAGLGWWHGPAMTGRPRNRFDKCPDDRRIGAASRHGRWAGHDVEESIIWTPGIVPAVESIDVRYPPPVIAGEGRP